MADTAVEDKTAPNAAVKARLMRRYEEREAWNMFWKIFEIESRGTIWPRTRYYAWRGLDAPVTWFREKIVEPLQDRNKKPFYHRRIARVPEIDECATNDLACIYEANKQYTYDKNVDNAILKLLNQRRDLCVQYFKGNMHACKDIIEQYEENEFNYFVKYGELGIESDVRSAYFKQKHRLIWERRHPQVMEQWQKALQVHKEKVKDGNLDFGFWKGGQYYEDKQMTHMPYTAFISVMPAMRTVQPLSKDWRYYKQKAEEGDPNPDGERKYIRFFPWQ